MDSTPQEPAPSAASPTPTTVSSGALKSCFTALYTKLPAAPMSYADAQHFLHEKIKYSRVYVTRKLKCGVQVGFQDFEDESVMMERLHFLEHMLVWLWAVVVRGGDGFASLPQQRASAAAIHEAMLGLSGVSPITAFEAYQKHVFERPIGATVTWYARNTTVVPGTPLFAVLSFMTHQSELSGLWNVDWLRKICNCDGMAWQKAWVYSGGGCSAGHHVEDGFLDFLHVHVKIDWRSLVDGPTDATVPRSDEEARRDQLAADVLNTTQRLAVKSWLFGQDVASVDGLQSIVQVLRDEGCLSPDEETAGAGFFEYVLHQRNTLLNPTFMLKKYPERFSQQLLLPGDAVWSNESHSVFGFSSLCMAWNICTAPRIDIHAGMERAMAAAVRETVSPTHIYGTPLQREPPPILRGMCIEFCITQELLDAAHVLSGLEMRSGLLPPMSGPAAAGVAEMRNILFGFLQKCWKQYKHQLPWAPPHVPHFATSVDGTALERLGSCAPCHSKLVCCACGEPLLYKAVTAVWGVKMPGTYMFCGHCYRCVKDHVHEAKLLDVRSSYDVYWHDYHAGDV